MERLALPDFKTYYKANSDQDTVVLLKEQTRDQWNKDIELIFGKGANAIIRSKENLFNKWC